MAEQFIGHDEGRKRLVLMDRPEAAALFAILTAIAWFMHRANISRLLSGSESKIGAKG